MSLYCNVCLINVMDPTFKNNKYFGSYSNRMHRPTGYRKVGQFEGVTLSLVVYLSLVGGASQSKITVNPRFEAKSEAVEHQLSTTICPYNEEKKQHLKEQLCISERNISKLKEIEFVKEKAVDKAEDIAKDKAKIIEEKAVTANKLMTSNNEHKARSHKSKKRKRERRESTSSKASGNSDTSEARLLDVQNGSEKLKTKLNFNKDLLSSAFLKAKSNKPGSSSSSKLSLNPVDNTNSTPSNQDAGHSQELIPPTPPPRLEFDDAAPPVHKKHKKDKKSE